MRHYEPDSARAAARILALTLLADGGVHRAELESLMRTRVLRRLGLDDAAFEHIVHEYCDDLLSRSNYLDGLRMQPPDEVIQTLLDDIRDERLQDALLQAMQDIVAADGVETGAEIALLAGAVRKWGLRTRRLHPRAGAH